VSPSSTPSRRSTSSSSKATRPPVRILRRALEEPLRRIAINAGQDGSVIVAEGWTLKKGQGYDARPDEYGDMLKLGIIDPAKVTPRPPWRTRSPSPAWCSRPTA
jgi:chaperonin GroEL (HSP60 family)